MYQQIDENSTLRPTVNILLVIRTCFTDLNWPISPKSVLPGLIFKRKHAIGYECFWFVVVKLFQRINYREWGKVLLSYENLRYDTINGNVF